MKTHLNLLPQGYRRRRLIRQRLAGWSAVWTIVAVLAGGAFWTEYRQYNSLRAELTARESEYAPIKTMSADLASLRKRIDEMKQREALALSLVDEQPILAVVGIVSRAASQCGAEICVRQFSLTRQKTSQTPAAGRDAPTPNATRLLTLQGLAVNHPSVLSFVDQLRQENVFDRVELKSSAGADAPKTDPAHAYVVECVF